MMKQYYCGGEVINQSGDYILTYPRNEYDMNYHLYNTKELIEYLVDIDDIQSNVMELEEFGGVLFSEFLELDDIEEIKSLAWKIYE